MALVTDDFRLYHELVPLFEAHGVPLLGVRPGERVPDAVEVVVGGAQDDPRCVALRPHAQATLLAVIMALDGRRAARAEPYGKVVFGIDPGDAIGLAVVADGRPLMVDQVFAPEAAVALLVAWQSGLAARAWFAHIGDGAPMIGVRLEGLLHKHLDGVAVRFVPEQETTPGSPETRSRHTDAAILIAFRHPSATPHGDWGPDDDA